MTDDLRWRARAAGAVAAGAALAVAGLATPSLVAAVGQAVIRVSPGFVSRLVIDAVGTADKALLVVAVVMAGLAIGARLGVAAAAGRAWRGDVGFVVAGALGVAASWWLHPVTLGRALVVAVLAAAVGAAVLRLGLGRVVPAVGVDAPVEMPGAAMGRRRMLAAVGVAGGGIAVVGLSGFVTRQRGAAATKRAAVQLPAPKDPAPGREAADADADAVVGEPAPLALPAGTTALVTSNRDFYRIDESLVAPSIDVESWMLRITGLVDTPLELTYDDLLREPLIERHVTLSCVSNEIGGHLNGTAKWLGVRLDSLLERAGVKSGAEQLVGRSVDDFTVGFPIEIARDGRDAMVAVGMNGEPLPVRHGFPARLVVPGLYGYVSATKWLKEIELTTWDFDPYWIQRGWAREAPIKVHSRIDVVGGRGGGRDSLRAGPVPVAGVAWAPHRGVAGVEVRIDGGDWQSARLGPSLGDDVWRQWLLEWYSTPGRHVLEVRATTSDGETQTARRAEPFPDGATGYHRVTVTVAK